MEVPFARFLTRFPVDEGLVADVMEFEPPAAFDPMDDALAAEETAKLEAERLVEERVAEARQEVETRYLAEIADLTSAHDAALAQTIADARTRWCDGEGATIAQGLDTAIVELRSFLDDKIADALTPLLAEAVFARTRAALIESLDLILADPKHPALTLRGPGDLLDAVKAACPRAIGIEYIAHSELDAIVNGEGMRIETRLETAIALLTQTEA